MSDGDGLTISLHTDAEHAIDDIADLQDEVKDLNAELEYALDLLDDLKNHEASGSLRVNTDDRLRFLEKRLLHGEYDTSDYDVPDLGADADVDE